MSALGHKQTCAVQNGMSALHPIADICGAVPDVRIGAIADVQHDYDRSGSNRATRGKITLISVNSPGRVSTSIEPPCCLTMMSWLMESPSPVSRNTGTLVRHWLSDCEKVCSL